MEWDHLNQQQLQNVAGLDQQLMGMAQCPGVQSSVDEFAQWLDGPEWEEYVLMRRGGRGLLARGRPRPSLDGEAAAAQLLDRHLTPEQREDLRVFDWFDVKGTFRRRFHRRRTRTFRIFKAGPSIRELRANGSTQHYCIMAMDCVPTADTMLAWKLLIEADVNKFLTTANRIGAPTPAYR
jgi:hypothetical protein